MGILDQIGSAVGGLGGQKGAGGGGVQAILLQQLIAMSSVGKLLG